MDNSRYVSSGVRVGARLLTEKSELVENGHILQCGGHPISPEDSRMDDVGPSARSTVMKLKSVNTAVDEQDEGRLNSMCNAKQPKWRPSIQTGERKQRIKGAMFRLNDQASCRCYLVQ